MKLRWLPPSLLTGLALAAPSAALAQRESPIVEIEPTGIALPGIGPERNVGAANLPDQIRVYRASRAWDRQIARITTKAARTARTGTPMP